ncbi:YobH family protein [Atlantibacter subterraneus]|uniref:YobH family protein n=1 Tax=Atlantibacter subterraneus TaxID=255519 RepID=UPI0020C4C452|nr:YobH family protein [Atlantibacter subterranea]UTJ45747.1 YobH family protein [Atlantibacter subterranea]
MQLIIRLIAVAAILWLALLFSGYGILIGSHNNAAGLGLQCKYMTARQIVTAQFIHSESGIVGISQCPLLRKSETVIDN